MAPRKPKAAEANAAAAIGVGLPTEVVDLSTLKAHPKNYKNHPEDQIEHIQQSIIEHGLYRPVVIARDSTILAGHGVTLALKALGAEQVTVVRLDLDPNDPRALKLLVADNEIEHLGEDDDRLLSELLKSIRDDDVVGLLGTGFDDRMLANLVYVTRPAHEVTDFDEAAAWVGMPEYEATPEPLKIIVSFRNEEDIALFCKLLGVEQPGKLKAMWFPPKVRDDASSVRFED